MPGGLETVVRYLRRFASQPHMDAPSDAQLLDRFIAFRDEAAFEELMARHGPLVLSVCRRILGPGADADDAFQATFFVLVKKADSLRRHEALGSWLHGVACRCALKAKTGLARRRSHERQAATMATAATTSEGDWSDVGALIDEEIGRLPAKYREPIILCYIQGHAYDQAARTLGCPKGTLAIRLSRARNMLQARLGRRGVHLGTASMLALLEQQAFASMSVPQTLAASTLKTAVELSVPGVAVPAGPATGLMHEVLRDLGKARWQALLVTSTLVFAALGGAIGLAQWTALVPDVPAREARTPPGLFPDGPPRMIARQVPQPEGGRVVLYSRSRHGNYPLATYAFHLGLRGDDHTVANDVNLVFGNARRQESDLRRIDSVAVVAGHGAVGMEAFDAANVDEFRVTCLAGSQHRIVDLGAIDFDKLLRLPERLRAATGDEQADVAEAIEGHVYAVYLSDREHPLLKQPRAVKFVVLAHRDHDAVLIEWKPLAD